VTRRDRERRGASSARPTPDDPSRVPGAPVPVRPEDAPPRALRSRLAAATVPAGALLPLRFFFGVTFVYAGIDKLIDPTFFNAADPASIQAQLADFARVSPIAPLVHLSEPFAVPIGLLIALAEIAIGLGALTGLAYRLAAAAGATLSILFFLTASWTTRPYYFGPDLPYAVGWLTLALAGHSGLLVPRKVLRSRSSWTRPPEPSRSGPDGRCRRAP